MVAIYIVLAIIIVLVIYIAAKYNGLVRLNVQVNEAWSDITVQLKRRYDLIPNLVNTVKGYASHEKEVFEKVTAARANAVQAKSIQDTAKAENQLSQTLKSLFAVAENYPDLKANQGFLDLQSELVDTEDKIQASRRFYNGAVLEFNTKIQVFPTNIFAKQLGFKQPREFFELSEAEQAQAAEPVKVNF